MKERSYLTAGNLGMDRESIKRSFAQHIEYTLGKDAFSATARDFLRSLALAARDRMFDRWSETQQGYHFRDDRRVYYLSLEWLESESIVAIANDLPVPRYLNNVVNTLFGLTETEVSAWKARGYDPREPVSTDASLRNVIEALTNGTFSPDDPGRYRQLAEGLLNGGDPYFVLADFDSYQRAQFDVETCYADQHEWVRKAILNVAGIGRFSSDATIRGYAHDIWRVAVHGSR